MSLMVQYGLLPQCNNNCKFCLRLEKTNLDLGNTLKRVDDVKENIKHIDWNDKFAGGISLLGGEIYFLQNKEYRNKFLSLIEDITSNVLAKKGSKYSTVTNGIYDINNLLLPTTELINNKGIEYLDLNFSYDLKYRFKNDNDRKLVLKNINTIAEKYNYRVGVQMILTQYVIDAYMSGEFDIDSLLDKDIHGCNLQFLYPHPISDEVKLDKFFLDYKSFIRFYLDLKEKHPKIANDFRLSVFNSCCYKWTGMIYKKEHEFEQRVELVGVDYNDLLALDSFQTQQPVLSGYKSFYTDCGHSELYRCFTDKSKCLYCLLEELS